MKHKIIFLLLVITTFLSVGFLQPIQVNAADSKDIICQQVKLIDSESCGANSNALLDGALGTILQVLIYIIGAASVIVLIIAGMMYVFSGGNPNNTTRAKEAIIYALVGIAVALLAQGIVAFIITRVPG